MSIGMALAISVVLLLLNAFFVAAEFAVVAAKRHRLEERAATGSRAAKAAVAASKELSLMLAGAQLGITLCTLGLGALAKPTVADLVGPLFAWLGVPEQFVYVVSLVLAVAVVVFLHMVVGEMAPKSWAISHPESSALLLALPFRGFARVVRPFIWLMNTGANGLLRLFRVDPVDQLAATHGPAELNLLLAQSHEHGALADQEHQILTGALRLEEETVSSVMFSLREAVTVPLHSTVADVEQICRDSGRSRLFVVAQDRIVGLVHVRDAVRASAVGAHDRPVEEMVQPTTSVPSTLPLIDAVGVMREERAQLALVEDPDGQVVGLASLEDILEQILGEFDDESDADEQRLAEPASRRQPGAVDAVRRQPTRP